MSYLMHRPFVRSARGEEVTQCLIFPLTLSAFWVCTIFEDPVVAHSNLYDSFLGCNYQTLWSTGGSRRPKSGVVYSATTPFSQGLLSEGSIQYLPQPFFFEVFFVLQS